MGQWDETCDVLVVGSGAGGMTGAYAAAREGLAVILVESTDRFGGMSAYSGGGMWFPCNAALKRAGSDDTMEEAREYYHSVVGDRTPRALQDRFLETGARLIDYLEQDPAFAFMVYPWPDYYDRKPHARADGRHIVPASLPSTAEIKAVLRPALAEERRGHPAPDELGSGQALIGRFLLALGRMRNAELLLGTELVALVRDGERVTGAIVRTGQGERRIGARRGVIVAAGGFERNAAMRAHFGVPGEASDSMAPPGNTGRPIEAAMAIGADVDLMDQAWWSLGLVHPEGAAFTLGLDGGIFVDQDGRRFVNESLAYDRAGRQVIALVRDQQLKLPFWLIYDDRDGGLPPAQYPTVPFGDAAAYRAADLWRSAPTLEGLAAAIGVPPETLADTVARFNGFAATGEDPDFARGGEPFERLFTGGASPLKPIVKPPFHAAAFSISDLGTKGGLRTDAAARVLDREGRVIPGLYAAGNSMAAVSGEAYPGGGNPIGSSMVFAYLAAQDIASNANGPK